MSLKEIHYNWEFSINSVSPSDVEYVGFHW